MINGPPLTILMPTFGSAGDVHPFIGLARALQDRGHRPTIIANALFQPTVEAAGVGFIPFGNAERYAKLTADPRLWDHRHSYRFLMQSVTLPAMRPLYDLIAAQPRQGLVLASSYLAFGARLASERLGIPLATVHLQPAAIHSLDSPPVLPGLPDLRILPRPLRRWILDLLFRRVVDPVVAEPLNTLRAELGLTPVRDIMRNWLHSPHLTLCLFPGWFAKRQEDWPPASVTTDFVWQEGGGEPDAELRAFVENGTPPLVVTAGTAMQHAKELFAQAAEAARLLGRRALLVTPARDQIPTRLPSGVIHTTYAPFSWLLKHAALVIHHGGVGTAARCLRAGVPQLVTPFSLDQPDNADILKRLGVAEVLPPSRFQAVRAAAAIDRLLNSAETATRCAHCAALCRSGSGAKEAAERIETLGLRNS